MNSSTKRFVPLAIVAIAAIVAFGAWYALRPAGLPDGFASSNGRAEAVEINVAAKLAGRVDEILVKEGDYLEPGQELVHMDVAVLSAQLREAKANLEQAKIGIETAENQVTQADADERAAEAVVAQRQAQLDIAKKTLDRAQALVAKDAGTVQALDEATASYQGAVAAVSAAEAQRAAAKAGQSSARSGVVAARAKVDAAEAAIESIQANIDDSTLTAPRAGRVQYLVARPGEIVAAGGTILNLVDLTDVYMTFFLPTSEAGRVAIGTESRIVLDAAPEFVIPATVSFVADVAQFTPKTVETEEEREKLTFRIKASVDPKLLRSYIRYVKTGLPGVAYVRLDPKVDWPDNLQVSLPDE